MGHREWIGLGAWLAACYAVALVGSQFSAGAWYDQLAKPSWTPPGWLFGPVWTVLYGTMAVAAWIVWRDEGFRGAPLTLGLFVFQLALNLAWSWVFFGRQEIGLALVNIVALVVMLLLTIVAFWSESRLAGALLVPYLLWVIFASALNYEIWRLNRA